MAKKFIDADDASTIAFTLYDRIRPITCPDGDIRNEVFEAYKAIGHLPAADVQEVRHGYWENVDNYSNKCSCCGRLFELRFYDYKYCPRCGVRMDGEENDKC